MGIERYPGCVGGWVVFCLGHAGPRNVNNEIARRFGLWARFFHAGAVRVSRIAFRFGDGVICAVVSAGSASGVVGITRAQSMLEGVWDTCQKGLGFRYSLSEVAALRHQTMAR